ncbi:hypothetical protein P3U41_06085 [Mammaliicoccus sciuri]|uniref:hypothetical protein n=1 Tax=Mammaliicoccus sciuri TaxID=1296 RepID=UPI002B263005|nr:hypothetical protein [Mammaliicoccus sciuri]WQL34340.1 hypothetical protein P3U41_06085 [Mammaliicoccus sciuri]WQL61279.1 hypothetical protein P3T96_06085 [Mammaliicoccus sciuri]
MVKIKTKKEMTLSELIEYGFNNPKKIKGKIFKPQSFDSFWNPVDVRFSDDGCAVNVNGSVTDEDVYTVEIEEPITEDMELHIVERYISRYEDKHRYTSYLKKSIKAVLKDNPAHMETTHIYTEVNGELVLIWENGKLVE